MKIDRIEIRQISLPYKNPFRTSGWVEESNNSIIVKVYSEGLFGYGESAVSRFPFYIEETSSSVYSIQKDLLIPLLVHKEISSAEDVIKLYSSVRGNKFAIAGIESAVYDLLSKKENKSLSDFLGGVRKKVPVGVSIGIADNVNALLATIENYLKQGYNRIKIKISPEWDIDIVKQIRKRWSDLLLQVDANSAYTIKDTEHLKEFDLYELLMIEQPFANDDLVDHKRLQEQILTSVCLDESITSFERAEQAIDIGSCKIINIKQGRVGGIYNAKKIHDFCYNKKVPVWCGGMLETGIGRAINVALASLPGFTLPGDISTNDRYFRQDIVENPFNLNNDSTLNVLNTPGHGAVVNEYYLEEITVRKEIFN